MFNMYWINGDEMSSMAKPSKGNIEKSKNNDARSMKSNSREKFLSTTDWTFLNELLKYCTFDLSELRDIPLTQLNNETLLRLSYHDLIFVSHRLCFEKLMKKSDHEKLVKTVQSFCLTNYVPLEDNLERLEHCEENLFYNIDADLLNPFVEVEKDKIQLSTHDLGCLQRMLEKSPPKNKKKLEIVKMFEQNQKVLNNLMTITNMTTNEIISKEFKDKKQKLSKWHKCGCCKPCIWSTVAILAVVLISAIVLGTLYFVGIFDSPTVSETEIVTETTQTIVTETIQKIDVTTAEMQEEEDIIEYLTKEDPIEEKLILSEIHIGLFLMFIVFTFCFALWIFLKNQKKFNLDEEHFKEGDKSKAKVKARKLDDIEFSFATTVNQNKSNTIKYRIDNDQYKYEEETPKVKVRGSFKSINEYKSSCKKSRKSKRAKFRLD